MIALALRYWYVIAIAALAWLCWHFLYPRP
mgnify:CR=1 FL=1